MSLRYLTAGESHGSGLTAILEGLPSHLEILTEDITTQLRRRQAGYGRGGRMKIESDTAEITAGVRHGKTLGSPLALWIANIDFRAWTDEMAIAPMMDFVSQKTVTTPRPGHADLSGGLKYNEHDLRNVLERASARETTARVAIGAICRKLLAHFCIRVTGHVINIGGVALGMTRPDFATIANLQESDPCRCIDTSVSLQMQSKIDAAKKAGDTVGGIFEIIFTGLPIGLGSHVHADRKLDAKIAASILSIPAVKGVEFGLGFASANEFGSAVHDPIIYNATQKKFSHTQNNAGGIVGGMTNGENLVVRGAMKPISTLYTPLASVDVVTKKTATAAIERSDTCAVPAASVIAENILCIDIASALIEKFGGDSLEEMTANYANYVRQIQNY